MNSQGNVQQSGNMDAAFKARLRRIHVVAGVVAALWIVATVACMLWGSDRILSEDLTKAAQNAERDATDIAHIVNRMFAELEAIPQVLSTNREIRSIVSHYNALERSFTGLEEEQRRTQLKNDSRIIRSSRRLTRICKRLGYDLLYVLDRNGNRIISANWDSNPELLGLDLSDREYYKEAMAERSGHQFAISRTTRKPVLFFSAPIEDEEQGLIIGAVVVRQTSELIGTLLSGGQHATLIVDKAGMVVAASRRDFYLRHVGLITDKRPDADTLRDVYGQKNLRELGFVPPVRRLHKAEGVIDGNPYLATKAALAINEYSLLVLSPTDWIGDVRQLHYIIGTLTALFGLLIALLGDRRASSLARQNYHTQVTIALNEKLTAANTEKDRYLGIAAHDLRNPLSSMRGLSELMLETPLEQEQQREFLETIHRTSDEMLGLVNDLLDVSVIESGKLELRRSDHDLAKLVNQRIRHLMPHARSKKIRVTVDAAEQRAYIDSARFSQVIDNLVSNAIKFSPSETTVQVALRSEGGHFTFSVQDQGPGIPEAERKLLFRSFQKLSARPTGGEKSTGLGLAIVKRIVDAHGGSIEVDSAPGGGTRFTVTAPVQGASS